MPLIVIFFIGVICSSLCITFYAIHFIEIRRMNREYDERQQEREQKLKVLQVPIQNRPNVRDN